MFQYNYQESEIKKMLFTELVLAYAINENSLFYKEIVKRLKFCEFEDEMITQLITYELEILKRTSKNFDKLFINKKWWLEDIEKYSTQKLLKLPLEQYLLYYQGDMPKTALTNSEIISIYDEANFITTNNHNFSDLILEECNTLCSAQSKQNLKDEFIHRIDYIYERELNIKYNQTIFNKIMKFFINESHILFLYKYNYSKNEQINWTPYTNEFFNHYDF